MKPAARAVETERFDAARASACFAPWFEEEPAPGAPAAVVTKLRSCYRGRSSRRFQLHRYRRRPTGKD